MPKSHRPEIHSFRLPLFAIALAACSGESIELGTLSRDLSSGSACRASDLVDGSVVIENQAQLDQLAGCATIAGDLHVRPFESPDFTPLAALTTVGGAFELGRESIVDGLPDESLVPFEEALRMGEREAALIATGWLESLDGLQNLRRVGSLILRGLSAPSLEALESIGPLGEGGLLEIGPCFGLRDLRGLEGLTGVADLLLTCDSLESLAGLPFSASMRDVSIAGAALADLGAFDVKALSSLSIEHTALENLDALSGLMTASSLSLVNNRALRDASGLDGLVRVDDLSIFINDALTRLPDFASLVELDTLFISGNAALSEFPAFTGLYPPLEEDFPVRQLSPTDYVAHRPSIVEISGNHALERITMPPSWLAAGHLVIAGNTALRSVELGNLEAIEALSVYTNRALQTVDLGVLDTVDRLWVVDNPQLPLEGFAGLRTFESTLSAGPLEP